MYYSTSISLHFIWKYRSPLFSDSEVLYCKRLFNLGRKLFRKILAPGNCFPIFWWDVAQSWAFVSPKLGLWISDSGWGRAGTNVFLWIIRVLHTLLIQIKGIHISFYISLIILYMVLHVHLGSKLHPYISCFPWSLLLHLLFWNITNNLGTQLFMKWSLSLCWKGIFRKKIYSPHPHHHDVLCWFQKDPTI